MHTRPPTHPHHISVYITLPYLLLLQYHPSQHFIFPSFHLFIPSPLHPFILSTLSLYLTYTTPSPQLTFSSSPLPKCRKTSTVYISLYLLYIDRGILSLSKPARQSLCLYHTNPYHPSPYHPIPYHPIPYKPNATHTIQSKPALSCSYPLILSHNHTANTYTLLH